MTHWVNVIDWDCQVFDEQEAGQFHLHLSGAKNIVSTMTQRQRAHPVAQFLMAWLLYYDVLSAFAHPSRKIPDELGEPSYSSPVPNLVSDILTHQHARIHSAYRYKR